VTACRGMFTIQNTEIEIIENGRGALPVADLYARNREIGLALARARRRARKSMKACAEVVGTSRQRYAGFETGKTFIEAVELEALMRFLQIPLHEVLSPDLLADVRDIPVQARPGETLRIVVNVLTDVDAGPGVVDTAQASPV
jgi:transcriptional regulator with XRE-family HTH domain